MQSAYSYVQFFVTRLFMLASCQWLITRLIALMLLRSVCDNPSRTLRLPRLKWLLPTGVFSRLDTHMPNVKTRLQL